MFNKCIQSVRQKPVNWFLLVAILVATLVPAHYHLHHDDVAESLSHSHAIDLHLISDEHGSTHHEFDTTSFAAVPDDAVKMKSALTQYLFIAVLLAVIPILRNKVQIRPKNRARGLFQIIPHFTPLLRAPPLH